MGIEDPGKVNYSEVGGLSEQIRELREVTVLYGTVRYCTVLYGNGNGTVTVTAC